MFSAVELVAHHLGIVLFAICALAALVIAYIRRPVSAEEAAGWPSAEATIQSVGQVVVNAGRNSYTVEVGDFSYVVSGEYNSGRLTISRSFSTHDASTKDLVDKKVHVLYNPRKPDQYSVPQQEIGGFLLDPYDEPFGQDIGPVDLNLDKI